MTELRYEAFCKVLEESGVIATLDEGVIVGGTIEDTDISARVRKAYDALFLSAAATEDDTVVVQPMFTDYTAMGDMPFVGSGAALKELTDATAERCEKNAKAAFEGAALSLSKYINTWIPQYQSIKRVQAFKIKSILLVEGGYALIPEDQESLSFKEDQFVVVDKTYFDKHQPKTGGYYVLYADGYQSWSPASPFESGNILINLSKES